MTTHTGDAIGALESTVGFHSTQPVADAIAVAQVHALLAVAEGLERIADALKSGLIEEDV